jgi:hypothetical protein
LICALEVWFEAALPEGSCLVEVRDSLFILPVYPNLGLSFLREVSRELAPELGSGTFRALSLLSLIVLLRESCLKLSLKEFLPLLKVLLNIFELVDSLCFDPKAAELPVVCAASVMWVDRMPSP